MIKIELDDVEISQDNSGYILDVAKSSSYQNQTEKYYEEFGKWRTKKNNPYGYAYVKDVRERTYVDGKGFVSDGPDKAERLSLANCFKLLGILLIISQIFTFLEYFVIAKIKGVSLYSHDFFADFLTEGDPGFKVVATYCFFEIMKLLVPVVLFFFITKMPFSVALPKSQVRDYELTISGIAFMLLAMIFGRTANYFLSLIFEPLGLGIYDFSFLNSTDIRSIVLYSVVEYVILAVLIEVFFRGVILQIFRQYGDLFALITCCITNVLFYGDVTNMAYLALTSVIISLFTMRSGSIFTAIAMRLSVSLVSLAVSMGISYVDKDVATFVEAIVSIAIVSFALITYSKMISSKAFDFNITDSYTHLSAKSKCIVMFSTMEMIVWFVLVLVMIIFNIRFV